MKRFLLIAGLLSLAPCAWGGQPLRFEAETCTTPVDAWQPNKHSADKWNLWSTDQDAAQKWSGGVTLQSPSVTADRQTGEEGAPVLHTVVEKLPAGNYDIYMNGTRALGVSRDGQNWQETHGGLLFEAVSIPDGRFELWFDDRFADANNPGSAYYDYLEFRQVKERRILKRENFPPVQGWATERREEDLDRGVVALTTPRGAYVGWRLLKSDPADAAFDVYCRVGDGAPQKLNTEPIVKTTDFVHETAPRAGLDITYLVCPAGEDVQKAGAAAKLADTGSETAVAAYVAIKLKDEKTRFQKIALADLNGDGLLDYVIKYPNGNVDPWVSYWKPSPDTFKIEAYLHDGTYLWTRDLGWSIERGIWYSPYVVADLTGDGKAEIAVKTGEGDPRDKDGRVGSGPEWLSIWDGMTGEEITKTPWPSREPFLGMSHDYNYYSRNQIAVAYLDGKTPCVLALRGTYNLMLADAYQLNNSQLEKLWSYSNEGLEKKYQGQGEHFTHAADVDGDGRDEVMLGSVMLDDTGFPLWTTGLGHDDAGYLTDVIPDRPGLEIYYIIESRQPKHGMCVADAKTGELIWAYDKPTNHVHSAGMCADIDPLHAGMEGWAMDCAGDHKPAAGPWLWSAKGELLAFEDPALPKSFDITTVYWDADLQKECLFGKRPTDFRGQAVDGTITGGVTLIADLLGDWREEIIATAPGEIRIYSSTIPAFDRRVCLLQDPIYRADVRMDSMGYTKVPSLSYCPSAQNPNVNLTLLKTDKGVRQCRVVVSAPLTGGLQGTVKLNGGRLKLTPDTFSVDLMPGQLQSFEAEVSGDLPKDAPAVNYLEAVLETPAGTLRTVTPANIPNPPAGKYQSALPKVEAEAFTGQGGGQVQVRTDKVNVSDRAISHWDSEGHWLEWKLNLPEAGRYELVIRYCTAGEAQRDVTLDGQTLGRLVFSETGGLGDYAGDWQELKVDGFSTQPQLTLSAGEHLLRLTNVAGTTLNLDFIAYRKIG